MKWWMFYRKYKTFFPDLFEVCEEEEFLGDAPNSQSEKGHGSLQDQGQTRKFCSHLCLRAAEVTRSSNSKDYLQSGKKVWKQMMEKYINWENRVKRRHRGWDSNKGEENVKEKSKQCSQLQRGWGREDSISLKRMSGSLTCTGSLHIDYTFAEIT